MLCPGMTRSLFETDGTEEWPYEACRLESGGTKKLAFTETSAGEPHLSGFPNQR
jgi:hypothetical protein